MVHHICLLETKLDVSPEKLETLIVETRIRLLKLPEVANLRVGKRIDTANNKYQLFFSLDTENMDKLAAIHESAVYTQFEKQVLRPHIASSQCLDYEMEPGKDVRYS
jgi:Stress responsive A/B Barrel Domain